MSVFVVNLKLDLVNLEIPESANIKANMFFSVQLEGLGSVRNGH